MCDSQSEQHNVTENSISIDQVELYYVYSFALSRIPLRQKVSLRNSGETKKLHALIKESFLNISFSIPDVISESIKYTVDYHESEEQEPEQFRATLYTFFPHLSIKTEQIHLQFNDLGLCKVDSQFAIFESGLGVLWLKIKPNSYAITLDTLINVTRRGKFPSFKHCKNSGEEKHYIHILYYHIINTFIKAINEKLNSIIERINLEWLDIAFYDNRIESKLFWADTTDEINAYQLPSIALIVKHSDSTIEYFNSHRNIFNQHILRILHTCVNDNYDICHDHGNLNNLYPDKRFKTYCHSDCLLVLTDLYPDPENKVYKHFIDGLFRTYCAIRGIWHMYSVLNEQVDDISEKLYDIYLNSVMSIDSAILKISSEKSLMEELSLIIRKRGEFLSFISVEDPLIRSIGQTGFSHLFDLAKTIYDTEGFHKLLDKKLLNLDNFYNMIDSYVFEKKKSIVLQEAPIGPFLYFSFLGSLLLILAFFIPRAQNLLFIIGIILTTLSFGGCILQLWFFLRKIKGEK